MTRLIAKKLRRVMKPAGLLAVMAVFGGCTHHSLDYMPVTNGVTVRGEFECSDPTVTPPKEMTVHFFPESAEVASSVAIYDFKTLDGGLAYLKPGRYMAVCYNSGAGGFDFIGRRSFYDFGMQLRDVKVAMPVAEGAQDERMVGSPDRVWAGALEVVDVPVDTSDLPLEVPRAVIRFRMEPVVQQFTVRIREAKNYNSMTLMRASISGLAGSYHPGRGATGEEPVTLSMPLKLQKDGTLEGQVLTFGHCRAQGSRGEADAEAQSPHYLVLHAVLADGRQWAKNYDVTGRIHASAEPHPVLELKTLTLPEVDAGDGFQPSVGEWGEGSSENIGM